MAKHPTVAGVAQGWYAWIRTLNSRATCSRCGIRTALVGQDGDECLRCLLERWREARATGEG
jgi:hypothetical protein